MFLTCVCYLVPVNSSYNVNANDFFDNLLFQVSQYQDIAEFYICGDFNARCGDMADYIEGVDHLPVRQVIDYTLNAYSDLFVDFLINVNCCIVNGRNSTADDYTFVSTRGCSVVDYCLTAYETLSRISNFKVLRASQLVNSLGQVDIVHAVPDHSFLQWSFSLDCKSKSSPRNAPGCEHIKYDTSNIPQAFMLENDVQVKIFSTIASLESSIKGQVEIDNAYDQFCNTVKSCMDNDLQKRHIKLDSGVSNKKRKILKPWWNDTLSVLWNDMCAAEKEWLRETNTVVKARKKHLFICKRKTFDKEIRLNKRRYTQDKDKELLETQHKDQREFWRKIGKIGVGQNRQNVIPLEVKLEDGSVSDDIPTVLNRWKTDFSNLLNPVSEVSDANRPFNVLGNNQNPLLLNDTELNETITHDELIKVLKTAGSNKASGHDTIPTEVLKNETSKIFLLRLFNVCFQTGKAPTQWSKCILNPIPKSSTSDKRDPMSYRGIALAPSSYKLFCGILNNRLVKWADANGILADEQNGFRKGRSTVDHISSRTNIIETRKLKRKQTFVAFIDFRKAYDSIDRSLLWLKLEDLGIGGNILNVIKSMYNDVEYCVRLNGINTEWFKVMNGLKQG